MKPQYLTVKDFAEVFAVTPAAVHKWILQKKIDAIQIAGNIWRIPIAELENFKDRSRRETNKNVFTRSF